MAVLVLNTKKRSLMPYTPNRARKLLASSRARADLQCPFCIRRVEPSLEQAAVQPLRPRMKKTSLPVETDTGGWTQRNRSRVLQRADGDVWQTTHIELPTARATTASRSAPFLTALKDGVSRRKI